MSITNRHGMTHSTNTTNLADLLERILDKGVVVAGDIKIKLVEIELLTIQIRLVICSVERAVEMGMDFWRHDPNLSSLAAREVAALNESATPAGTVSEVLNPEAAVPNGHPMHRRVQELEETLRRMEARLQAIEPDGQS